MPRTKNPAPARPAAARSTARTASATAPAPAAGPAPGSPTGAIYAALAANPGATTAAIADAAGISRAAARDALTTLESAGEITRTKGGKPGIPDTWNLAARPQPADDPGPGQHPAQPGDSPAASDQDGLSHIRAGDGVQCEDATTPVSPGHQDGDTQASSGGTADPAAGHAAQPDDRPAGEGQHSPGEGESGPDQDNAPPASENTPEDSMTAADSHSTDMPAEAALVADITGRIGHIQATASAAAIVLTGGENLAAALAGLDEICEQATQARRTLKAAIGGKKAPAVRPGGLRDKILAHLRRHPGQDFTPHEIHKVIGHSSGAIANALDTLVKHGQAELGSEKPRKFHLADDAQPASGRASGETDVTEPAESAA